MVIIMIAKLKQEEKELKNLIKDWEDYDASNKKHYNIPLPSDITKSKYCDIRVDGGSDGIANAKGVLSYLDIVCNYYDCNDYVVTLDYCIGNFSKASDIEHIKITEKHRKEIHRIRNKLKYEIDAKESKNKE